MAATVTPLLTLIHDCDSVADWTGSPTLDTEVFIQGTGSLSAKVSKTTYTAMKPVAAANLTDQNIYAWMNCATPGLMDTKANGGLRIRIEDAAANWREWYVAGLDTYFGGWECFVVRADYAWDAQSATPPDITAITAVGVVCKTTASVAKTNFWWDVLRYGTGLRITGGTEADPGTFADVFAVDDAVANKYGVLTKFEEVYFVQGELRFGSTETDSVYFKDISQLLIFRDRPFPADYEVVIEGNTTGTTKVFFGEKSGEAGISGCIFKPAGAVKFKLTATDSYITAFGLYGCTFLDAGTISLPSYSVDKEVLNSNFEACAEVLADTCIIKYCKFISADGRGVRMSSTDHHITECDFISCPKAIHIDVAGTYLFDALMFSGNTYDIENSTDGGNVYIDRTNGSNPDPTKLLNSGSPPGTITINPLSVYLTVDVEDEGGVEIEGAAVAIYKSSDDTELMNKLTDVNGRAQESFQYTTDTDIYIRIRKSSAGSTRYVPVDTSGTITSGGFTLTVVLAEDLVLA